MIQDSENRLKRMVKKDGEHLQNLRLAASDLHTQEATGIQNRLAEQLNSHKAGRAYLLVVLSDLFTNYFPKNLARTDEPKETSKLVGFLRQFYFPGAQHFPAQLLQASQSLSIFATCEEKLLTIPQDGKENNRKEIIQNLSFLFEGDYLA